MTDAVIGQARWRAGGDTARGPAHVAQDLPNQDAIAWNAGNGLDSPLVLAVSDGHSSASCFRSDAGSRFSVEAALEVLAGVTVLPDESGERHLAKALVDAWQTRVDADIVAHPFDASERRKLLPDPQDARLAYGATMLAVLVRPEFVLFAQIGDGDILCTDERGITARVFEKEPGLALNETRSLCESEAWNHLTVRSVAAGDWEVPVLILAATDGYANSFATESDFLLIGRDFRDMIRGDGLEAVVGELPRILADTTRAGSRDDITIGLVKRSESSAEDGPPIRRIVEEAAKPIPARRRSAALPLAVAAAIALVAGIAIGTFLVPQLHRESGASLLASAQSAQHRGDLAGALKAYERAIERDPSNVVPQRARALLVLEMLSSMPAAATANHLTWKSAEEAWAAVVALEGDAPAAADLVHLSRSLRGAGEPAAAVAAADSAARIDPHWVPYARRLRVLLGLPSTAPPAHARSRPESEVSLP